MFARPSSPVSQWSLVVLSLIAVDSSGHHSSDHPWSASIRPFPQPTSAENLAHVRVREAYRRLPMSFEANVGQANEEVKFLSRGSGYSVFLTPTDAVFALSETEAQRASTTNIGSVWKQRDGRARATEPSQTVMRMTLSGANPAQQITGLDPLPGRTNYFVGNDPSRWHTNVSTYARVRYASVYPGIDLLYHGNQAQLEYDFVVAPGTNPDVIRVRFDGADDVRIDASGDLIVQRAGKEMRQRKPVAYQDSVDGRREIACRYVIKGEREIGFSTTTHDTHRTLVIDPVLLYSTYLGGTGGEGQGLAHIAVDTSGNAYVSAFTSSPDFPTTPGAFQPTLPSDCTFGPFVAKLNARGSAFEYSTYLGGCGNSDGLAVDASGHAYVTVTGFTNSENFPTTPGALHVPCPVSTCSEKAFITKFDPTGSALVYSALIEGRTGGGIAIDTLSNAYITGCVLVAPPSDCDIFVSKLNSDGSALVYDAQFGGSQLDGATDIAVDNAGNAYVTGRTESPDFPTTTGAFRPCCADTFVTKIDAAGSSLLYSTFLGNTAYGGTGIAVDGSGNAYVTGIILHPNPEIPLDFPTTPGAFQPNYGGGADDAFLTKLNATGTALVYSTFLGGRDADGGRDIAIDSDGNAYITGFTSSIDFPTANPYQSELQASISAFVTKLNAQGSTLMYSTYLGARDSAEAFGIAVDDSGSAYVVGNSGNGLPLVIPAQYTHRGIADVFIAKIGDGPSCPLDVTGSLDVFTSGFSQFLIPQLQLQLVLVRNNSPYPIEGPLAFVTDNLQNGVLLNTVPRTTICVPHSGSSFVVVHAGVGEQLSPSEVAGTFILFFKSQVGSITYAPRVLSTIPAQ
jgi:hypothetical protein